MQVTRQQNASAEKLGRAIEFIARIMLLDYHIDFRREDENNDCIFYSTSSKE
jgi:hypothetical protein